MNKCDKYNGNCSICENTELPNIADKECESIGYSYAYKTDCAGERYIKAEEVKYLLECERNKTINAVKVILLKKMGFDKGYSFNNFIESLIEEIDETKVGEVNVSACNFI